MNKLQTTDTYSHNDIENDIKSIFQNMKIKNNLWELVKIEIDQKRSEIHVFVHANPGEQNTCSHCCQINTVTILKTNKIWSYLSIREMRTFIHADEIQIICSHHGIQRINPPWDLQINEKLKLSIL